MEDYQIAIESSADLAVGIGLRLEDNRWKSSGHHFHHKPGSLRRQRDCANQAWTGPAAFISSTASQGSCSNWAFLYCDLGSMAAGAVATVLCNSGHTLGTISNQVSIAAPQPDMVLSNNAASLAVLVQDPPSILTQPQGITVTNGNIILLMWVQPEAASAINGNSKAPMCQARPLLSSLSPTRSRIMPALIAWR